MEQPQYSQSFISVLALLSNAKDLIFHSDRQNADKVLTAVKIYAKENEIPYNEDKFTVFSRVLLDSRRNTLDELIDDIALDFIQAERKSKMKKK